MLGKVALPSIAVATVLLALEGAVRLLGLPSRPFVTASTSNCLRLSRTFGMEFIPNCSATWSEHALSGPQVTTFRTNGFGLRDSELADDGSMRILALGDSCTWGWEVPQDAAYPQALQRLLDASYGPHRYRVINAGIPGYTTYQGLLFLRERGLQLRPSIVIIAYGFNDSSRLPDIEESIARQRKLFPVVVIDNALLAHSALWRWLRTQFGGSPVIKSPRPFPSSWLPPRRALATSVPPMGQSPVRVQPAQFTRNLTDIVNLCRSHGADPILLSFVGPPRSQQPYAEALGNVAAATGTPLVVYTGPRIDVIHPTADGYEMTARAVFDRLQALRYIPAEPAVR